jgi:hypothetical protein
VRALPWKGTSRVQSQVLTPKFGSELTDKASMQPGANRYLGARPRWFGLTVLGLAACLIPRLGPASDPVTVAGGVADLNGDGRPDQIELRMDHGRRYVDTQPWCGMSPPGTHKYEGHFILRVTLAGQRTVETDLNALLDPCGDLWFHGDAWRIVFKDFNQDGKAEFSLGQYGGCNGWLYRILGVDPTGHVVALSDRVFSSGDHANSSADFHLTQQGFRNTWYDNSRGTNVCNEFRWAAKAHRFQFQSERAGACPEDRHSSEGEP